jgi:tripartite-type tricarboxylate transporter receptor subunit TctC
MKPSRRNFTKLLGGLSFATVTSASLAQSYSNKPVRLVVGYPPGGVNDIVARKLAPYLSESLGVTVIVDNRPGANGVIAAELVAKAPADGTTLLVSSLTSLVLNPLTYKSLPYDPVKDFLGITTIASSPILLAARPGLGVGSLTELIRLAKIEPGKLNFATVGSGGSTRVVLELLKLSADIDIKYVPYKGAAPAISDLLGATVDGMGVDFPALYPFVKDGRLTGLAITSERRNPLLPDLPTAAEQGIPALTCGNWYALLTPAKTSTAVVVRLYEAVAKISGNIEFKEQLNGSGVEPMLNASPQAFNTFLQAELGRWGKVIKAAAIEAE